MTDYLTNLPKELLVIITEHPDLKSDDVMSIAQLNRKLDGMFSIIKPIWQRKKAAEVASALPDPGHIPSPSEVAIAAKLAAHRKVVILPSEILVRKGEDIKTSLDDIPSLDVVKSGAALAQHGFITQVPELNLYNLDISAVPAEDMASLVKCVQVWVIIDNVTGPLGPILGNVKCDRLYIDNTMLGAGQTESLVAAMVTGLKGVGLWGGATLDMETLGQYDGTGECGRVELHGTDNVEKYGEEVKEWAQRIGWETEEYHLEYHLEIKRVLQNIEADEDEWETEDEGDDEDEWETEDEGDDEDDNE